MGFLSVIRRWALREEMPIREIARRTGLSRNTIKKYLREGGHTQAEIAYMVGFSDQSNFARAFKRWTGMSPGQFQKTA